MKLNDSILVPVGGLAAVAALALTLIVVVVMRSPNTHHHIMATIDPNYGRTKIAFASDVPEVVSLPATLKKEVSFSNDVSPILKNNCAVCHRPLKNSPPPAKLDFTSYETMMKSIQAHEHGMAAASDGHDDGQEQDTDGDHMEMIVPGNAEKSMLVEVLRSQYKAMPPITTAPLSDEEKQIIATWIAQGAKNN